MDIHPKPKLVMNIMPSFASSSRAQSEFNHWKYQEGKIGIEVAYDVGEKTLEDMEDTDIRIGVFLRETVLPMAVQTNALIILTFDHCNLSKAMGTMVEAEAAKAAFCRGQQSHSGEIQEGQGEIREVVPHCQGEYGYASGQRESILLKKIEEWRKLDYGLYMGERFDISAYIAAINLLESKNLYSRNIADIEGIRATIKKVAKIDRLPDDNSNEGMQIIQMA
ncbi:hypothetical protein TrLO_g6225 [Triparma laevis f. longispina]|uniref:Uncharacterized protein n=1 Tax=Triparma laevis f. longispina TaxID=1714387 RepID=A0A9W7FQ28_9STRA|nr:hypothetical protein TrLO_g6225 [Triparma laevis f. longispina]